MEGFIRFDIFTTVKIKGWGLVWYDTLYSFNEGLFGATYAESLRSFSNLNALDLCYHNFQDKNWLCSFI
jgi:hypothetical protein